MPANLRKIMGETPRPMELMDRETQENSSPLNTTPRRTRSGSRARQARAYGPPPETPSTQNDSTPRESAS